MTVGPVVAGLGIALLSRVQEGSDYLTGVFPAIAVFGAGLGIAVAPLTTAVLAAAQERHSGVASGVNNAVARSAQLLAVAVLPVVVGLTGDAYNDAEVFAQGFADAMVISGAAVASGGVLAFFVIDRTPTEAEARARQEVGAHCDMAGPPLRQPTPARR